MNSRENFADIFCQRFPCPRPDFAEAVLWRCVPTLRKTLVRLIWRIDPGLYQNDLFLIGEVGNATTVDQVREIINFFNKQPATRSFIRQRLKARLSRGKLQALAESVLGQPTSSQATLAEGLRAGRAQKEKRAHLF